jgi:hypothetical protein
MTASARAAPQWPQMVRSIAVLAAWHQVGLV